MPDPRRFNTKAWLLWTAGFLAFPIAGILAEALTGRINDVGSALIGGMGEQVGPDGLAEGGQLLGPVAGAVQFKGKAGVDLVDESVDQIGLAADMGVEGGGGDPEVVGQAAHGQGSGALLVEQGQGFLDNQLPG